MTVDSEPISAAPPAAHSCPQCGQPFTPRPSGKPQRFCSATCRKKTWGEAYRLAGGLVAGAGSAQNQRPANVGVEGVGPGRKNDVSVGCACRWCGAALLGRPRSFCLDTECATRFTTALRRWALQQFEAGRLTTAQLRETDQRWLDAAEQARKAGVAARRRGRQDGPHIRRRSRDRGERRQELRALRERGELPS